MDTYFQRMDKIVEQKKIQMRVRFMLQDIIELRKVSYTSDIICISAMSLAAQHISFLKSSVFS